MFGKEGLITLGFILFWYALNIGFNINNKALFNQFPFPWTVSVPIWSYRARALTRTMGGGWSGSVRRSSGSRGHATIVVASSTWIRRRAKETSSH